MSEIVQNEIVKINSIQDYLDAIELYTQKLGFLKGRTLFRGMNDSSLPLIPKVYHTNGYSKGREYAVGESDILSNFMKKSYSFLSNPPKDDDYQKWIAIAQHYGIPTRILDWSEGCLVSLFFAVKMLDTEYDGVVWALNPTRYKNWFMAYDEVCKKDRMVEDGEVLVELSSHRNIVSAFRNDGGDYQYPYFYYPFFIDERMKTQQSVFMVWGSEKRPLDKIGHTGIIQYLQKDKDRYLHTNETKVKNWSDNEFLLKLVIDRKKKHYIKRQLDMCGINEYSIFPTLDSFGQYLNEQYRFDGVEHLDIV
jgi:hypothetical protein